MAEETIPQMRERIEALEKQVKSLSGDKDTLNTENRTLKAREFARDQGYDPVHGELFASSTDGDITADGLSEFANKFGLNPTSTEVANETTSTEESAEDNADAMDSFSRAGSGPGTAPAAGVGSDTLTRQEYMELAVSNPAAAKEAVAAGRVQLRSDNPWVNR